MSLVFAFSSRVFVSKIKYFWRMIVILFFCVRDNVTAMQKRVLSNIILKNIEFQPETY